MHVRPSVIQSFKCFSRVRQWAVLSCLVLISISASGQKNDTIWIKDGLKIVGEINQMQLNRLNYSTHNIGTLNITWTNVVRVESPRKFIITTSSGREFRGVLLSHDVPGEIRLGLGLDTHSVKVPIRSVVEVAPHSNKLIYRLRGNIDGGFSYTKSSDVLQYNVAAQLTYTSKKYMFGVTYDAITTLQGDIDKKTSRTDFRLIGIRNLRNLWFFPSEIKLEQNSELGLDLRSSFKFGIGKYLWYKSNGQMSVELFPVINNERYSASADVEEGQLNSFESQVSFSWRTYTYNFPELKWNMSLEYYYNFTIGDRHRIQSNLNASYEVIDDLYLTASIYETFDSKPPSENGQTNDWGTTFGFRYEFTGSPKNKRKKK